MLLGRTAAMVPPLARCRTVEPPLSRGGGLVSDALVTSTSLLLATLLDIEQPVPREYGAALCVALPMLVVIRVSSNALLARRPDGATLAGPGEAVRLCAALLAGSGLFLAAFPLVSPRPLPRAVYILELFLTAYLAGLYRFWPRIAEAWRREWAPPRRREGQERCPAPPGSATRRRAREDAEPGARHLRS